MMVAFSRQGPKKVYVQNLLKAHAKVVNELLETNGHIYVCGDAKYMARDVQSSFVEILTGERGIHQSQSKDILKDMRTASRYQVGDQERTPRLPLRHSLSPGENDLLISWSGGYLVGAFRGPEGIRVCLSIGISLCRWNLIPEKYLSNVADSSSTQFSLGRNKYPLISTKALPLSILLHNSSLTSLLHIR